MIEKIILAGGCFWCTEAIFKSLKGVYEVIPGYSGGSVPNPTYYQVSSGKTGHAEAVNIVFNNEEIDLTQILYVFFKLHDPTQINRQGADTGTQYRSAIFYTSIEQLIVIRGVIEKLQKSIHKKIVTTIEPFENFFEAEPEHKDYYLKNRGSFYCNIVIDPKIQELRRSFPQLVQ